MSKEIYKIDEVAIKIEHIKNLIGALIQCPDMPKQSQSSIMHMSFDTLTEGVSELLSISAALTRTDVAK